MSKEIKSLDGFGFNQHGPGSKYGYDKSLHDAVLVRDSTVRTIQDESNKVLGLIDKMQPIGERGKKSIADLHVLRSLTDAKLSKTKAELQSMAEEEARLRGLLAAQAPKYRRICDILAATPFAVRSHLKPGFYRSDMSKLADGYNLTAAETLMKQRTTVVFADEVAMMLRGQPARPLSAWTETPGVMPPFEKMFVEARTGAEFVGRNFVSVCVAAKCTDYLKDRDIPTSDLKDAKFEMDSYVRRINKRRWPEIRAIVTLFVWVQWADGSVWGPVALVEYGISHDFRVMLYKEPDDFDDEQVVGDREADKKRHITMDEMQGNLVGKPMVGVQPITWMSVCENDTHLIGDLVMYAGSIFAQTCGLMNASNVRAVVGGITNEHVGEKRRVRERLATIKYHVLKLKVGTKLIDIEPGKPGDRPSPLTIVRGHFKNFEKNGLFGKYKGEKYNHIWVRSFARGDAADGIVEKDYEQSTQVMTAPQEQHP